MSLFDNLSKYILAQITEYLDIADLNNLLELHIINYEDEEFWGILVYNTVVKKFGQFYKPPYITNLELYFRFGSGTLTYGSINKYVVNLLRKHYGFYLLKEFVINNKKQKFIIKNSEGNYKIFLPFVKPCWIFVFDENMDDVCSRMPDAYFNHQIIVPSESYYIYLTKDYMPDPVKNVSEDNLIDIIY